MNYYTYYPPNAHLRLELMHVRGVFTSSEEEIPPQIKFHTSKNLLKDPLPTLSVNRYSTSTVWLLYIKFNYLKTEL